MRNGALILLIVTAGFFAWLAVTDRIKNLPHAWDLIKGSPVGALTAPAVTVAAGATVPTPPPISAAGSFVLGGPTYNLPYGSFA